MPERCIFAGCANITDTKMASLRIKFPSSMTSVQRQNNVEGNGSNLLDRKHAKWLPSRSSVVCSELNEGLKGD